MSMGWGLGASHVLARALAVDGEGRKESGLATLCQMTAAGPSMANKSSPEALLGCLTARTAEEAELGNQEEEWGS